MLTWFVILCKVYTWSSQLWSNNVYILKIKAAFQDDPQGKEFVFNGLTDFLVPDDQSEGF